MAEIGRKLIGTFDKDDRGVRPYCVRCDSYTRSFYSCMETAETAVRLLGWAPSKFGFVCDTCLREKRT